MSSGKVYLVGAGPGAPDLITLKGLKILHQADVVIYDHLVDRKILEYAKPDAELICGDELFEEKYINGFTKRQNLINNLMIKKAKQNKMVVRLKNGDPMIFARANEELEALTKNKIEFVIIPGVTAATAAACYSGIPLTVRGVSSSIVITTGHEASEKNNGFVDWNRISQIDTIVLYMAVENLTEIINELINSGKKEDTPVAIVSNTTKLNQNIIFGTLKNIRDRVKLEKISAPAIVIIGEVVKKEKKFNWFKKTKKTLFTGISSERYFENGLIFHVPMIEIKQLDDYTELDNWIKNLSNRHKLSAINYKLPFDWIVFSSRFGVFYFFKRLFELREDTRSLKGIKIAAIGSSTANKLKEYGIIADLIPKKECSDGLINELKKIIEPSTKILLPRSDIADKGLADGLKRLGAKIYPVVVYRNVMPKNLPELDLNFFDEIIFSSPSTVRNFIKRYGKPPERIKIRTIGPVTEKEWNKYESIKK